MTAFRSSASFGKRQEYIAVAELLKRGYDVYMTLVDDQQIDCVVRLPTEPPRYLDIQIKARSSTAKHAATFAAMEVRRPRPDFFFIFYSEAANCYWVIPSLDVCRLANQSKSGANEGKYAIKLANRNVGGGWNPRPKFEDYRGRFDLLGAPSSPLS